MSDNPLKCYYEDGYSPKRIYKVPIQSLVDEMMAYDTYCKDAANSDEVGYYDKSIGAFTKGRVKFHHKQSSRTSLSVFDIPCKVVKSTNFYINHGLFNPPTEIPLDTYYSTRLQYGRGRKDLYSGE